MRDTPVAESFRQLETLRDSLQKSMQPSGQSPSRDDAVVEPPRNTPTHITPTRTV